MIVSPYVDFLKTTYQTKTSHKNSKVTLNIQRHPVKHLRWGVFVKIIKKVANYFPKKLHHRRLKVL